MLHLCLFSRCYLQSLKLKYNEHHRQSYPNDAHVLSGSIIGEKIYCSTSMCWCSFTSSYKPQAGETGCFSTHVGRQAVVNQPKHHVSPSCFLPSDTSTYLRDTETGKREIALGLRARLSRQIVFRWWMNIPPVISHQAKVSR